jgi:ERCC4-related helicase
MALSQVDLVLCYDAHASPIRDIQRSGRTGRHKDGRVIHLLAAGREETMYQTQQMVGMPLLAFSIDSAHLPMNKR